MYFVGIDNWPQSEETQRTWRCLWLVWWCVWVQRISSWVIFSLRKRQKSRYNLFVSTFEWYRSTKPCGYLIRFDFICMSKPCIRARPTQFRIQEERIYSGIQRKPTHPHFHAGGWSMRLGCVYTVLGKDDCLPVFGAEQTFTSKALLLGRAKHRREAHIGWGVFWFWSYRGCGERTPLREKKRAAYISIL